MEEMRAVYAALIDAQDKGTASALATVISVKGSVPRHEGSKMLVYADARFVGTVGGGAMESLVIQEAVTSLSDGQTRLRSYTLNDLAAGDPGICGGTVEVFIEPLALAPRLLVIGGGHVGKALAQLANWMDFHVILSDDRVEFCNPEYLPGMREYIVCKPAEITTRISIDNRTYIAAVTRGLPVDIHLIPVLLATNAAYIGLIGSRRRWTLTAQALREQHHLTSDQLSRVRAPIGLELQAESPKEIAISIMAEITMLQHGGTGQPMQWIGELTDAKTETS